jgi:hypothetical protein
MILIIGYWNASVTASLQLLLRNSWQKSIFSHANASGRATIFKVKTLYETRAKKDFRKRKTNRASFSAHPVEDTHRFKLGVFHAGEACLF